MRLDSSVKLYQLDIGPTMFVPSREVNLITCVLVLLCGKACLF